MSSYIHYEQAFETYLQRQNIPYVPVDQTKKAIFSGERIKSFDFILYPRHGRRILADVKGRKFPYPSYRRGNWGQTWTTTDDVEGLTRWEEVFGEEYLSVFVFAYWLCDQNPDHADNDASDHPLTQPQLFETIYNYQQRDYTFVVADLHAYRQQMRHRSDSWQTVFVPAKQFKLLAQSFDDFVRP